MEIKNVIDEYYKWLDECCFISQKYENSTCLNRVQSIECFEDIIETFFHLVVEICPRLYIFINIGNIFVYNNVNILDEFDMKLLATYNNNDAMDVRIETIK